MAPNQTWAAAEAYWRTLQTDAGAVFDKTVHINASEVSPTVTWGTSPEQVVPINGIIPSPSDFADPVKREGCRQALAYMGLTPGTRVEDVPVDKVFIGSCTNARIEDFRAAAQVLKGKAIAPNVRLALAVPGSGIVKRAAEDEGIDIIFKRAGFQWREAGCSLCVGLNEDALAPTERCASTSNRNFESRQGTAGRTHLVSPIVAAATAIKGTLAAPSQEEELAGLAPPPQHIDVASVYSSDSESLSGEDSASTTSLISSSSEYSGSPSKVKRVWTTVKKHVKEHHESMTQAYSVYYGQGAGRRMSAAAGPAPSQHTPEHRAPPQQAPSKTLFDDNIHGSVVIIERANIDTDAIFPKQFCTTTQRTGLGHALFHNFRYHPDGSPKEDFILNHPESRNASVLLATGPNFGCGSSREHAVWALKDFGFRCIIAPSFADIFYNNAFKNGLLLAKADPSVIERIVAEVNAGRNVKVSLQEQAIRTEGNVDLGGFDIPERRKQELLSGIGEIEASLAFEGQIRKFEEERRRASPWYDEGLQRRAVPRQRMPERQSQAFAGEDRRDALVW